MAPEKKVIGGFGLTGNGSTTTKNSFFFGLFGGTHFIVRLRFFGLFGGKTTRRATKRSHSKFNGVWAY